ncbi:MAG: helix-turn-helix transcriptional regulator [Armatimonadetes bacterium]|nr:helix-turn-helix transcriptional regulator [Armatimonadota bacterium]
MRYVRAFLGQPPGSIYYLWGDIPPGLADWVQPPDTWRVILYGHNGDAWQNARPYSFGPRTGAIFAPGTRGGHLRPGPQTDMVSISFTLESDRTPMAVPTLFQVSQDFYDGFIFAVECGVNGGERGKALLWHLLWSVSQPLTVLREQSSLYEAEDYIAANLHRPLAVGELAAQLGVSQRTLLSWFQAEHAASVRGYIRQVRAREACRLLAETSESIKAVAANVGVPDLQQFNKLVRSRVGLSPRAYRERSRHGASL